MIGRNVTSIAGERLKPTVRNLWLKYYPDHVGHAFEQHIASIVRRDMRVLEIGAGSGTGLQHSFDLRGRCAFYAGVDLDRRVLDNPSLDSAYVADATELPFKDETFDLVFHKMVAEHLEHPGKALLETARVLKPGGLLLFETPSRFYYPMLAAHWTPTWFHRVFVRTLGSGRSEVEVFPKFYRLNDQRTIRARCREAGFDAQVIFRSTPPGYLRFSRAAFLAGVVYERLAERRFPALRAQIWVAATKHG
jgi:ubiquinone/menaquinone biosynthesis C-methylase UbiE